MLEPISQTSLYNFDHLFNHFVHLYQKKSLPKVNLISGQKGLGKSTFVFHLINYLLSLDENSKYDLNKFKINNLNKSFNLVVQNLHPNLFLLNKNKSKNYIEIEQTRNLLIYLNKSVFLKSIKIVFINDCENLNINSSNSLLKAIEEPSNNTFFFLTLDSSSFLINTIKSRCQEFKVSFDNVSKLTVLKNLLNQFEYNYEPFIDSLLDKSFTPGSIINFINLKSVYTKSNSDDLQIILDDFIKLYIKDKNPDFLLIISHLIESIYHELFLLNSSNTEIYNNKNKIMKNLYLLKKLNLDSKNIFFEIKNIINHDKR